MQPVLTFYKIFSEEKRVKQEIPHLISIKNSLTRSPATFSKTLNFAKLIMTWSVSRQEDIIEMFNPN